MAQTKSKSGTKNRANAHTFKHKIVRAARTHTDVNFYVSCGAVGSGNWKLGTENWDVGQR